MPKKETKGAGQEPEKIVTKYDLKMQRRKEEKEKAIRDARRGKIIGILLLAALVCIVVSFPVRNYLTLHETYVTVDGGKVSKVEFDYNYNVAVNSYLNQYGMYLYYLGVDTTRDITNQMYSDTLTWGDFFEQMAVENIARNRKLMQQAEAEGFTYDVSEDYAEYRAAVKEAAAEAGETEKSYLKTLYGPYATESRVRSYVQDGLFVSAYSEQIVERLTPSQEEIQEYYENNRTSYDSVDYYMARVDAELPTEPTELADPQEETEGEGTEDSEAAYEPSEAEIEAAMKEAKEAADLLEKTVRTDGELYENMKRSSVTTSIRDWLFDDARKTGDTTVIEDSSLHRYYVVRFVDRYLEEVPSADLRVVVTAKGNGQAVLDEWKSGEATEESFAALCDRYNDPADINAEGGLLEAVSTSGGVPEELGSWLTDSARVKGDTIVVSSEEEENDYVAYYVAPNDAEWILSIRNTLLEDKVTEYMEAVVENIEVQDPKNRLRYLQVMAEEAAAAESASQESEENSEASGETEGSEGSEDGTAAGE